MTESVYTKEVVADMVERYEDAVGRGADYDERSAVVAELAEELEVDVLEVPDGQAYWDVISDLAAPVMRLVNQLDDNSRESYIKDVIDAANICKQGESLCMRGTTWIAAAAK